MYKPRFSSSVRSKKLLFSILLLRGPSALPYLLGVYGRYRDENPKIKQGIENHVRLHDFVQARSSACSTTFWANHQKNTQLTCRDLTDPAELLRVVLSNLVDSASSHTLVSKIKPCMSKYKSFTLKLRMAHYISYSLFDSPLLLG